ncbi:Cof-type HAD-IIB family hydrolase [Paenibacillus turpanensis]|uniref:Cof-type HAD-IIB family hydrolase n=1 Tax=Paenibacillus turpanensis TaxID=2689078 RepID=UPI00140C53A3
MIKFVAFDVDGTLRERDYLPDSTRKALRELKESGVTLALCTGRSEYEMASLREELGIDWAVTCNGSHIGYKGKTLEGKAFSEKTISAWLHEGEEQDHGIVLYTSDQLLINKENHDCFRRAQQEIGFMEPMVLKKGEPVPDVYQCIVFCNSEEEKRYVGEGDAQHYVHRWRPWAVDINPSGMNKAVGLKRLLDRLEIPIEEAAAFGDGINDLEMIAAVGTGVAMGNAVDELKQRAKYVTKPLHEDGIAYAVRSWII